MKISIKILITAIILVIDYVLISLYLRNQELEPSISIAIIILVPVVFVINIAFAILCFFLKRFAMVGIFVLNAFFASIIMYYLFGAEMDKQRELELESWTFNENDTLYDLTRWKKSNLFSLSYSVNPGSSTGFLNGKSIRENNSWILISDSVRLKIDGDNLIGFKTSSDTINMMRNER